MSDDIVMTPSAVHAVADSVANVADQATGAADALGGAGSLSAPGFPFAGYLADFLGKGAANAGVLGSQVTTLAQNLHGAASDIQANEGRGVDHVNTRIRPTVDRGPSPSDE